MVAWWLNLLAIQMLLLDHNQHYFMKPIRRQMTRRANIPAMAHMEVWDWTADRYQMLMQNLSVLHLDADVERGRIRNSARIWFALNQKPIFLGRYMIDVWLEMIGRIIAGNYLFEVSISLEMPLINPVFNPGTRSLRASFRIRDMPRNQYRPGARPVLWTLAPTRHYHHQPCFGLLYTTGRGQNRRRSSWAIAQPMNHSFSFYPSMPLLLSMSLSWSRYFEVTWTIANNGQLASLFQVWALIDGSRTLLDDSQCGSSQVYSEIWLAWSHAESLRYQAW